MKKLKFALGVALAALMTFSAVGCGKVVDGGVPEGRTEIKISLFAGGFGTVWLEDMIKDVNASQDKYWYVKIPDNKLSGEEISENVMNGIVEADIYFAEPSVDRLIAAGKLMDLTDVYGYTPEGESKTIREKAHNYENYRQYLGDANGIYAMPYVQGIMSAVYDHDLFEIMGWLRVDESTENGLTKGTDGIEGTYDDGLPETYEQFKTMVNTIRKSAIPFIYGSFLGFDPYTYSGEAIWAQYEGLENYSLSYTLNGTYRSPSNPNRTVSLTPETGYKMYSENAMEGYYKAMDFIMNVYDAKNNKYDADGMSHTDAQGTFVVSHNMTKPIAMLIDGIWWENEARRAFAEDAVHSGDEYAYGKRDFRMMPMPAMPGQAQSSNGKHFFWGREPLSAFALKQTDETKEQGIVEFLRAFASDKNLRNFTRVSGNKMDYEYTLTETEESELTPFSKNVFEIMSDPNTVIVQSFWLELQEPYSRMPERWKNVTVDGKTYTEPNEAYNKAGSLEKYMEEFQKMYDADRWRKEVIS